jgi:hypothetical protein
MLLYGHFVEAAAFRGTVSASGRYSTTNGNMEQSCKWWYGARWQNRFFGEAGWNDGKSGVPYGYDGTPASLYRPIRSGGIGSRTITGTATVSGSMAGGKAIVAALTAGATVTVDASVIASIIATLSGSSALSASASAQLALAANLTASGNLSGALGALANVAAELEGDGAATATMRATGTLAATLTVAEQQDFPTASEVAAEVMDESIESGMTLRQALRIIAAATAGKVSGAETTTITFRSAHADDADRIIATVDEDGNRTNIVLDMD